MSAKLVFHSALAPSRVGRIACHPDGNSTVVCTAEDGKIVVVPHGNESGKKHLDCSEGDGIFDIVFNKSGTKFLAGTGDNMLKLYNVPFDFESKGALLTRFEVATTAVAYSPCETLVAAGSRDGTIKVVSPDDQSNFKRVKAHNGVVKSLSFDPARKYLASSGEDGSVCIWDYINFSEVPIKKLDVITPVDLKQGQSGKVAWHPQGRCLAVCTSTGISIYDRETWGVLARLSESQCGEALSLDWSPNGNYIISAHADSNVYVWDVEQKFSLERKKVSPMVVCVAWNPKKNTCILLNEQGQYSEWDEVLVSRTQDPVKSVEKVAEIDEFEQKKKSVSSLFADAPAEDPHETERRDNLNKLIADKRRNEALEKQQRKESVNAASDDVIDNSVDLYARRHDDEIMEYGGEMDDDDDLGVSSRPRSKSKASVAFIDTQLQASFMPNASPHRDRRRYLTWNSVGLLVVRYDDSNTSHLEVEYADQGRFRNVLATRKGKIRHGALGTPGFVLCTEPTSIAVSSIFYQAADSLGPNADWQRDLPDGELSEGCAIGSNFIAVATNKGHLRVFSTAGAQLPIISIGRPYVTMVAREGMLAVVYHMGAPFAGCQNLGYSLFNMTRRHTLVSDQTLPLTPGSRLEWIGFSQDGALSTLDSQGVLRQLISHGQRAPNLLTSLISQHPKSYNFNFQWTPVLNSAESMDQKHLMGAKFWPISVTKEKMRYVPCVRVQNDEMTSAPVVLPRPVPGTFSLEVPILGLDGPGGVHEESYIRSAIVYNHMLDNIWDEEDPETFMKESKLISAAQVELDQNRLRLFHQLADNDKADRALDLVGDFTLRKSLPVAIKIAQATSQIPLAQRINALLQSEIALGERDKQRRTVAATPQLDLASSAESMQVKPSNLSPVDDEDSEDNNEAPPSKRAKTQEASKSSTRVEGYYYSDDDEEEDDDDDKSGAGASTQNVNGKQEEEKKSDDDDDEDSDKMAVDEAVSSTSQPVEPVSRSAVKVSPFMKARANSAASGSLFDTLKSLKEKKSPAVAPKAAAAPTKKSRQTELSAPSQADSKKRKGFSGK